ncbi:MAG: Ldh family oxidoreductase, partial [Anaerolineales bacterium]|nr:Ldh family oxidoreductase [Anaerolineales bacterium]
ATSATAKVNVKQAAAEGRDIPLGWANDADGNPTTNAKAGLAGSLAPLGGAKGFGLGLMVDILAAGLTGSHWSYQSSPFGNNEGGPPAVGQLFIAIDPAQTGGNHFADQLEAWENELLTQEGVRLPGSSRHRHRAEAEANGVAVPDELIAKIEAC